MQQPFCTYVLMSCIVLPCLLAHGVPQVAAQRMLFGQSSVGGYEEDWLKNDQNALNEALVEAAKDSDAESVQHYLDRGASVDFRGIYGFTALHWSSLKGSIAVTEILIEAGANVDAKSTSGFFYEGVVVFDQSTPLMLAASFNRRGVVVELIKACASLTSQAVNGWTPLHRAAEQGYLAVAEHLVFAGADTNVRSVFGEIPLHNAAFKGREEIVKLLVAFGSDIEAKTKFGDTPLHRAADNIGTDQSAEALLVGEANPNSRNNEGWTPLHKASWGGATSLTSGGLVKIIKLLATYGSDVNAQDNWGKTPLYLAAQRGNLYSVQALLEEGASPTIADDSNKTPRDVVCEDRGDPSLCDQLVRLL